MLWICTNASIDWNAISAVGTGAAAMIALVIWMVDRRDKHRKAKADGRLAAQLVSTELITTLHALSLMKGRLAAPANQTQDDWDMELSVQQRDLTFAFFRTLAPRARSERLERMLEANTSVPPELSDALSSMLSSTVVAVESALAIFQMKEVEVHQRLNHLRGAFDYAYGAMSRARDIALERARGLQMKPSSM